LKGIVNTDCREYIREMCKLLLTLYLLMWRIWWAPNNASKWQVGFNSAFKGLSTILIHNKQIY